jgi:hypothetical protein
MKPGSHLVERTLMPVFSQEYPGPQSAQPVIDVIAVFVLNVPTGHSIVRFWPGQ